MLPGKYSAFWEDVYKRQVHGIPSDREVLHEGDIISVDCGTHINGFTGDSAYTLSLIHI